VGLVKPERQKVLVAILDIHCAPAHSLACECLGQAHAVAGGLAHVGVVQEPVDGRGGERLGHELVERGGVQVRGDRDGAFLVGGVDEAVEPFGGVLGYRQKADVIDDN